MRQLRAPAACDSSPRGFKVDWDMSSGDYKVDGATSVGDASANRDKNLGSFQVDGATGPGVFEVDRRTNFSDLARPVADDGDGRPGIQRNLKLGRPQPPRCVRVHSAGVRCVG